MKPRPLPAAERLLLKRCEVALNDWIHCHAPEMCDQDAVTETAERITMEGGTLYYIAKLRQDVKAALQRKRATRSKNGR